MLVNCFLMYLRFCLHFRAQFQTMGAQPQLFLCKKGKDLRVWIVRAVNDTELKVWKEETGFRKRGGQNIVVVRECHVVKDDVVSDQDRKGNVVNMNVSRWVTNKCGW